MTPGRRHLPTTLLALALLLPAGSAHAAKRVSKVSRPKSAASSRVSELQRLGMAHLNRAEYSQAIERFSQAARAEGSSASYFLLGYAHYQRGFIGGAPQSADKKDALEAISAFQMALALDESLSALKEPHRLHQSLAMCYEAVGEGEKAVEAYKRAFLAAPANPLMPLYAARLRHRMGDLDKAEANLTLALRKARDAGQEGPVRSLVAKSPLFAPLLAEPKLAALLAEAPAGSLAALTPAGGELRDSVKGTTPSENRPRMREKDQAVLDQLADAHEKFRYRQWRPALEAYGDALSLNKDSAILGPQQLSLVYEKRGTCYNKLGQSGEAVRELQRAVQVMPYNSAAHYQIALAHSLSGRYAESLKALREAFKAAPSPGELRRAMLLAKTDIELEPVRDLPAFGAMIADYSERVARR